jgi:hypothetical protein
METSTSFSRGENTCEDFDWDKVNGKEGFDVVHVHAAMFGQGDICYSSLSEDHKNDLVTTPTTTTSSCTSNSNSKRRQNRSVNQRKQISKNQTASVTNANPGKKGGHHDTNVQNASDGVASRTTPPPCWESNKGHFHQPKLDNESSPFRTADAHKMSSPTSVMKNIISSS